MSKSKTPYVPYKTSKGDYAINIIMGCSPAMMGMFLGGTNWSPRLNTPSFQAHENPLWFRNSAFSYYSGGNFTNTTVPITYKQAIATLGSVLLCMNYGKDFYDVFALGIADQYLLQIIEQTDDTTYKELVGFKETFVAFDATDGAPSAAFPPYLNSIYWHLQPQSLLDAASISGQTEIHTLGRLLKLLPVSERKDLKGIQVNNLGADAAATAVSVVPQDENVTPPQSFMNVFQVVYPKEQFESLYDMKFRPDINERIQAAVENRPFLTGGQPNPLIFDGYPDFEEKIDRLIDLIKYYKEVQDEGSIVLSEAGLPLNFLTYVDPLEELKQDIKSHFEINGTSTTKKTKFSLDVAVHFGNAQYIIDAPVLMTGRSEDIIKKIRKELKKKESDPSIDNVATLTRLYSEARKEFSQNCLLKGWLLSAEAGGRSQIFEMEQQEMKTLGQADKAEGPYRIFADALYNNWVDPYVAQGPLQATIKFLSAMFDSLSAGAETQLPIGESSQARFYNPNLYFPTSGPVDDNTTNTQGFLTSTIEAGSMPLRMVNPRLVYLMRNLRQLLIVSNKTFDPGGCIADLKAKAEAAKTASKLITDASTADIEDLAAAPDDDSTKLIEQSQNQTPPGPVEFAKKYLEWPRVSSGGYNIPQVSILMNSPLTSDPQEYRGVQASLAENLSNEEKLKLIDAARNEYSKRSVPEIIEEVMTPNGMELRRRTTSPQFLGASAFINEENKYEFSYDVDKLVAKRNRSFGDQIGDELFRIQPRAPAKIRDIDDAYRFFLAKLDLAAIAREAMKCTFLKYSLDDLIEMMCDELLEKFFGIFGADPDEFVKTLNKIKARQYKAGPLDLTYQVQQIFEDLEAQFVAWSQAQTVQFSENIFGEVSDSTDSSKPPPAGSPSFYASISDGLDKDTKRMLCELLIGGAMGIINLLVMLWKKMSDDDVDTNKPGGELKFKECEFPFSLDLPDRLPHWSKILQTIITQVEKLAQDYVEQFVIVPLRTALKKLLDCSDDSPPAKVGDFLQEPSLDGLFAALDTPSSLRSLLKSYIRDVISRLTVADTCSLLKGEPSDQTIGVCAMVLNEPKYDVAQLQTMLRTKTHKISFFESLGKSADFEICDAIAEFQNTDMCNEGLTPLQLRMRSILSAVGFTPEEVDYQMELDVKTDKEDLKQLLTSFFGAPEEVITSSQIEDIVASSEAIKKVNDKALGLVLNPLDVNMVNYDFDNFKEQYAKILLTEKVKQLQQDEKTDELATLNTNVNNNGIQYVVKDDQLIGLLDKTKINNPATDPLIEQTNNHVRLGDFVYHEINLFGDPDVATSELLNLSPLSSDISQYYSNDLQTTPPHITSYLTSTLSTSPSLSWVLNTCSANLKQKAYELATTEDKLKPTATTQGVTRLPYSEWLLNIEELKRVISTLASQNFRELPEGENTPPTHLYDAVFEGIVVIYTRLFLAELMMSAPYIFQSSSPEGILDTAMVRQYIKEVMYPGLGDEFERLENQLDVISSTYLVEKSDMNVNYKASLSQLNKLAAEFFNKIESGPCVVDNTNAEAIPLTFRSSSDFFDYVDVGDTLLFSDTLTKNNQQFIFEKYASFDRIKPGLLSGGQVNKLRSLGILGLAGYPENPIPSRKQIISEKDLFSIFQVIYDETDLPTQPRNLIPLGFYVEDDKDAQWRLSNEGGEKNASQLYYSPNFQSYKMMYGLMAEKYFRTLILQFGNGLVDPKPEPSVDGAKAWPSSWFEIGEKYSQEKEDLEAILEWIALTIPNWYSPDLSQSEKDYIQEQLDARNPNFLEFVGYDDVTSFTYSNAKTSVLGWSGDGDTKVWDQDPGKAIKALAEATVDWISPASYSNYSYTRALVGWIWERIINVELPQIEPTVETSMAIQNLFLNIEREFFPQSNPEINSIKKKLLKDVDVEWSDDGTTNKTFKKYYNEAYFTHSEFGGNREVEEVELYKMFFPYYYRLHPITPEGAYVGKRGVFKTPSWVDDADLVLEGNISQGDGGFDPEIAMTTNPVFVRDFTYNHFNGLIDSGGDLRPADISKRGSLLPQVRRAPGCPGRMVGKFMFTETFPAGSRYLEGEQNEIKHVYTGANESCELLTKDTFIEKFNSYRDSVNDIYTQLADAAADPLLPFIGSGGTNTGAANLESMGIPRSIIRLEKLTDSDSFKAVDDEGKEYELFFKRINIRVPTRVYTISGAEDDDFWTSTEFHTVKGGVSYEDDGPTMTFIDTKMIPVVRVFLVEEPAQSHIREINYPTDTNFYTTKFELKSSSPGITSDTRICDIFENFQYGLRLSFPLVPSDELDDENLLLQSSKKMLETFNSIIEITSPTEFYWEKKYGNFMTPINSEPVTMFIDTFKNPQLKINGALPPKQLSPAALIPITTSQLTLADIKKNESGQFITTSQKFKDIFKNFPMHGSEEFKSDIHPFLQSEKLYGEPIGNHLYCKMLEDPHLRQFFRCGIKLHNSLAFATLQTHIQLLAAYQSSQKTKPFEITKDMLQKISDYIITNRDGDDI